MLVLFLILNELDRVLVYWLFEALISIERHTCLIVEQFLFLVVEIGATHLLMHDTLLLLLFLVKKILFDSLEFFFDFLFSI